MVVLCWQCCGGAALLKFVPSTLFAAVRRRGVVLPALVPFALIQPEASPHLGEQGDQTRLSGAQKLNSWRKELRHTLRNNCERALPRNCTQTRSYTEHTQSSAVQQSAGAIAHDEA